MVFEQCGNISVVKFVYVLFWNIQLVFYMYHKVKFVFIFNQIGDRFDLSRGLAPVEQFISLFEFFQNYLMILLYGLRGVLNPVC